MVERYYFIVGDFYVVGKIKTCMICICGTKERAEQDLSAIVANPPKTCLGNIKIASDEQQNCWWNQGGLD